MAQPRMERAKEFCSFLARHGSTLQRQMRLHLGIEGQGDCIPATWITTAFARSLGLKAEIVPCGMVIMNSFWTRRYVALGCDLNRMFTDPRAPRWKEKGGGIETSSTSDTDAPGFISPHLVSIIESCYLIDTTAWQFSRDEPHQTWATPVVLQVPPRFSSERSDAAAIRARDGSQRVLFYRSRPEYRRHLDTSLYRSAALIEPVYVEALNLLYATEYPHADVFQLPMKSSQPLQGLSC